MRQPDLESFIQLNTFPTGRRLRAFASLQAILAAGLSFDELSGLLSEAVAHDDSTRALEQRWKAKRKTGKISAKQARAQKEMQRIDGRMDRTLSALRNGAQSVIEGADPEADKELFQMVDDFIDEVLPGGVQPVSGASYVEEHLAVQAIVKKLQSEKLQPIVKKLGIEVPAQRLATLLPLYKAALDASGESLDFGVLRAARSKGQNYLVQIVAVILAKYRKSDEPDGQVRAKLLGPVIEQDEAISAYYRARRSVPDVDPKTGEEEPEDVEDASDGEGEGGGGQKPPNG